MNKSIRNAHHSSLRIVPLCTAARKDNLTSESLMNVIHSWRTHRYCVAPVGGESMKDEVLYYCNFISNMR